jgi:hypothetical protein
LLHDPAIPLNETISCPTSTPTNPQLLESSTIVDYGMKAIGQLLDKIFYLLLSELLKKISNELI